MKRKAIKNSQNFTVYNMTNIAIMSIIIAICSWISIPSVVPFTMQLFGVFLATLMLGGRDGSLSILLYIILGAIGLPVFSGFQAGLSHIVGPTGGYIIGFLLIGLLYYMNEKLCKGEGNTKDITSSVPKALSNKMHTQKHQRGSIITLLIGLLLCYLFGTLWFILVSTKNGTEYGFINVLAICVFPYIIPDITKLWLAILVSKRIKSRMR